MRKVRIIIKDGEVTLDVEGVKGKECVRLTKDIEEALGKVIRTKKKKEYYEEGGRSKNEGYVQNT